jgi:hypothetical protein
VKPGARRLASALLVGCAGLAGCSGLAGPGREGSAAQSPRVPDGFLGVYQGSFGSAHTDDPADDLNYIPCEPANERCLGGDEPLVDVLLELRRDPDGRVRIGFFRSAAARAQRNELDLLGRGCLTVIGPLAGWTGDQAVGGGVAVFPLEAGNRLCLNKLRPTSTHELRVRFGTDPDSGESVAHVLIDREVTSANYLYVEEGGKQRRVRIDLANTLETATDTRYRVCIEDDLGEYERCVMTDRELRRFVVPVPLPDGAALSYTWWYELTPKLRRTQGLYELEQHSGRFVRSGSGRGAGAGADRDRDRDREIAPTDSR